MVIVSKWFMKLKPHTMAVVDKRIKTEWAKTLTYLLQANTTMTYTK